MSDILSLILSAFPKVHCESCTNTRILVKTSKSAKLLGVSSSPKGLCSGALAIYCRRVYSSNISGLCELRKISMLANVRGAHVKPLWDETYLRSASPISERTFDGSGLRHSFSKSYNRLNVNMRYDESNENTGSCVGFGRKYLDGEIFVYFYRSAKDENILHEVRKFPHIPQLVEHVGLGCWFRCLHLIPASLSRAHHHGPRNGGACVLETAGAGAARRHLSLVGEGS